MKRRILSSLTLALALCASSALAITGPARVKIAAPRFAAALETDPQDAETP